MAFPARERPQGIGILQIGRIVDEGAHMNSVMLRQMGDGRVGADLLTLVRWERNAVAEEKNVHERSAPRLRDRIDPVDALPFESVEKPGELFFHASEIGVVADARLPRSAGMRGCCLSISHGWK